MSDSLGELTRTECLERLTAGRIGRVSVTHHAMPAVVPVNYVVDHGVVFRTRLGGMLDLACRGTVVAFEVDELAKSGERGWSVNVVGVANALDESEALRVLQSGLVTALDDPADLLIRISFGQITGRQIRWPPGRSMCAAGLS